MVKGQGATEYLVLLAVVLIVALVSVALLGFFPGMASDAQITQSQMYWQSAQPVAIIENGGAWHGGTPWGIESMNTMIIRIRNSGVYPIRITKVLGGGSVFPSITIPAISHWASRLRQERKLASETTRCRNAACGACNTSQKQWQKAMRIA